MNNPLAGNLLVASSLVTDPVLSKAVCLVVHQDESNVRAVILNCPMAPGVESLMRMLGGVEQSDTDQDRPDPTPTDRLISDDSDDSRREDAPSQHAGQLHFGGPMSGPVVALHQSVEYAEAERGDGIYVAAKRHHLESMVRDPELPFRLFVGHLSWDSEEFETEFAAGLWHVIPATADFVFASPTEMWPGLIHRATACSMARWLGIDDIECAEELN